MGEKFLSLHLLGDSFKDGSGWACLFSFLIFQDA